MKRIFSIMVLLVTGACLFAAPIRIGIISDDPAEEVSTHREAADYLGRQLGMSGGEIVVASDTAEMANLMATGKVDVFIDTVFASVIVQDLVDSKIILRRWKKGVAEYKAVFAALKSSTGLRDLSNLNGQVIGFSDEGSTSARWLPQALLEKRGYELIESAAPVRGRIGYTFYNDDMDTGIEMLLSGKINLMAMSSDDFAELSTDVQSRIKIIGESFPVPRQLISVRPSMDNDLVVRLMEVMTTMHTTAEGRAVLQDWERTTKCDKINRDILDSIRFSRELLVFMK